MLIGYSSKKLLKVCTDQTAAGKALAAISARRIFRALEDLAAFNNLAEIPHRAPPLDFHPLRGNRSGEFAVKIHGLDRICFYPIGDYSNDEHGAVDLATVTEIEITLVGDYHSYG